jgi:hypothetical protein
MIGLSGAAAVQGGRRQRDISTLLMSILLINSKMVRRADGRIENRRTVALLGFPTLSSRQFSVSDSDVTYQEIELVGAQATTS